MSTDAFDRDACMALGPHAFEECPGPLPQADDTPPDTRSEVETSAAALAETLHAIRCPHNPIERIEGPGGWRKTSAACFSCCDVTDALLASDWLALHGAQVAAKELREAAKEARDRGDVGRPGCIEVWDFLDLRADGIGGNR